MVEDQDAGDIAASPTPAAAPEQDPVDIISTSAAPVVQIVIQDQGSKDIIITPTPTAATQMQVVAEDQGSEANVATPTTTDTEELLDTIQESIGISGSVGGDGTQGEVREATQSSEGPEESTV